MRISEPRIWVKIFASAPNHLNLHWKGLISLPHSIIHIRKSATFSEKNWHILLCDPYLKTALSKHPQITYRRPPTFKNWLTPSRLRRHNVQNNICGADKGSYKCHRSKCLCCNEITHRAKMFTSVQTKEQFPIKHHLTCQTSYIIYLMECPCGRQYVGCTIQKLHQRVNKHRANICNKFLLHRFSKHISQEHISQEHPLDPIPFKINPIDHVPFFIQNRFEQLKKREVFWIYKLRSLQPMGLNEVTEVIIS